jgi:hypothetical protein
MIAKTKREALAVHLASESWNAGEKANQAAIAKACDLSEVEVFRLLVKAQEAKSRAGGIA